MGGERYLKRLKFDPGNPPKSVYHARDEMRVRQPKNLTPGRLYDVVKLNTFGSASGGSARSVKVRNDLGQVMFYAACNFRLEKPSGNEL
jgi:hypothetical protein